MAWVSILSDTRCLSWTGLTAEISLGTRFFIFEDDTADLSLLVLSFR
jgi:hypothetical protein